MERFWMKSEGSWFSLNFSIKQCNRIANNLYLINGISLYENEYICIERFLGFKDTWRIQLVFIISNCRLLVFRFKITVDSQFFEPVGETTIGLWNTICSRVIGRGEIDYSVRLNHREGRKNRGSRNIDSTVHKFGLFWWLWAVTGESFFLRKNETFFAYFY